MREVVQPNRLFRVRSWGDVGHQERIVTEPTFEAAAINSVEHLPLPGDGRSEIRVLVRDIESGHEHSFVIHLDEDEAPIRQATPSASAR